MRLFGRRARDKPKNDLGGGVHYPMGGTISGQMVNERTAMTVTAVYACVRILSEAIASLPLHVYRYRADGGKEHYIDHPLYFLLHDEANPEMTSFVLRETLMSHLLLWGNAYAQIIRDGNGKVLSLHPLLPNRMRVDRDAAGRLLYEYRKDGGLPVPLRREDVLHIPGLGFDGLVGYSPIAMAKNSVGLALATEEFGSTFFGNGANPGGVLESPSVISDPERLKESWHSQFSGARAHSIAVLEEGVRPDRVLLKVA
jgi:HK97 family phage portal protein